MLNEFYLFPGKLLASWGNNLDKREIVELDQFGFCKSLFITSSKSLSSGQTLHYGSIHSISKTRPKPLQDRGARVLSVFLQQRVSIFASQSIYAEAQRNFFGAKHVTSQMRGPN